MKQDSPLNQVPLIVSFSVKRLFGRHSYQVDVPVIDGEPSRLLLLHGDNGSGKTTLLRILWHTLSAADDRGHRGYLARTPFERFSVTLTQGRQIIVAKKEGVLGAFSITLKTPGSESTAHYEVDEDLRARSGGSLSSAWRIREERLLRGASSRDSSKLVKKHYDRLLADMKLREESEAAIQTYLTFLVDEIKVPLYLADDRSLYSDDPDVRRTRDMLSRRHEDDDEGQLSRLVFIELQVTLRRVNDYLRSLTLGGQNDGSANSNAIYMNVLRRLVEAGDDDPSEASAEQPSDVEMLLDEIAGIAPGYEKFELVPKFEVEEFRTLLGRANTSELSEISRRVISPFLSSLRARYTALETAFNLLQALIPIINSFLSEKSLTFTPQSGLRIMTADGAELKVMSLSSGERQLLTLLCNTVLARIDTKIFVVDEPELSLGVDWQRNILDALMDLTEGTGLQFIVATHSIEMISSRPEALVQLKPL